jgi:NAD(P)-dependent dehydrogenase (short-subunit alcohol dehydrogenase family)
MTTTIRIADGARAKEAAATAPDPTVGRTALVTGAGRGLGRAIAGALASRGTQVVAADVDEQAAEATAIELRDGGWEATATRVDVTVSTSAAEAVTKAVESYGRLDILVNNAGVDVTAPMGEISAAAWDQVLDVNLRGPANMVRAALPYLMAGPGDIVNITSTAAKRAWPNASAYHASKWGLLGLSHALHAECRGAGIRVTAIVCGGMRTPFLLERFPELDPDRLMDPSRVAQAIGWALDQPRDVAVAELVLVPLTEESWP